MKKTIKRKIGIEQNKIEENYTQIKINPFEQKPTKEQLLTYKPIIRVNYSNNFWGFKELINQAYSEKNFKQQYQLITELNPHQTKEWIKEKTKISILNNLIKNNPDLNKRLKFCTYFTGLVATYNQDAKNNAALFGNQQTSKNEFVEGIEAKLAKEKPEPNPLQTNILDKELIAYAVNKKYEWIIKKNIDDKKDEKLQKYYELKTEKLKIKTGNIKGYADEVNYILEGILREIIKKPIDEKDFNENYQKINKIKTQTVEKIITSIDEERKQIILQTTSPPQLTNKTINQLFFNNLPSYWINFTPAETFNKKYKIEDIDETFFRKHFPTFLRWTGKIDYKKDNFKRKLHFESQRGLARLFDFTNTQDQTEFIKIVANNSNLLK